MRWGWGGRREVIISSAVIQKHRLRLYQSYHYKHLSVGNVYIKLET